MPTTTTGLATSFITFSRPGASGGGATVTDADGKIKWAGHNLLPNSESFDTATYTKGNVTVGANSAVAPNGTTTADKIEATATAATSMTASVSNAGPCTLTVWAKKGNSATTMNVFGLRNFTTSTNILFASVNYDTGVVTYIAGSSGVTVVDAGSGWWRITLAPTSGFSAGDTAVCYLADWGTSRTAGDHCYLWGAHLYRSDLGGMQQNPAMPAGMQSYYPTTPRNLVGYSEDFSNWAKTTAGATVTVNAELAPNGLQTADLWVANGASSNHRLEQTVTTQPTTGTYSFYAKAQTASAFVQISQSGNNAGWVNFDLVAGTKSDQGTGITGSITSVGNGWYRCSAYNTNSPSANLRLSLVTGLSATRIETAAVSSGIYLWGAQLSDSASLDTYVPQYGAAVTSAAYYAPRLDFDPVTLAARGLLVEEQRQNLIPYSNDFPSWFPTGATIATTGATAPDGTNNGNVVTITGTGASFFQSFTATAGLPYTASIWVKGTGASIGKSATFWFWYAGSATGTNTFAYITLTANWQRVTVTSTPTGGGQLFVRLDPEGINTATVGDVVHAYGAQVEQGSFATSFIPTIGNTTATRTADVASVSTGAFPYSSSEGTWVLNFSRNATGGNNWVIGLTGSNTYDIVAGNTNVNFRYGATGDINAISTNVVGSSGGKVAGAYTANGTHAISVNGTAVVTTGTSTDPGTTGTVRIGVDGSQSSNTFLNGYIRQITYLPRRISNAELQSRTA